MQINNIKIGYCSDQCSDEGVFDLEISEEVIEAIKARRQAFARFREDFPDRNDQLCFFPTKGVTAGFKEVIAIHIMATPFENDDDREGFMLELNDADDYAYESEWLPFEALEKERFLLCYGDDNEAHEYEEGDEIDDYEAVYATSLGEAEGMLREMARGIRDADPAYYGGNEDEQDEDEELPPYEPDDFEQGQLAWDNRRENQ